MFRFVFLVLIKRAIGLVQLPMIDVEDINAMS